MTSHGGRTLSALAIAAALAASPARAAAPMILGTNFWDVQYGTNGGSDPFTAGHDNVSGDNPWKPAFLAEIACYSAFRFMDFTETNNALREGWKSGKWADRVQKSARRQVPMAYEWCIDLCNRVNRDMWINVVHMADDEHVRNLAQLIFTTLKPGLKCYVEYSNETWNDMFDQAAYCQQTALQVGISESNQWYRGQKYHAYRSLQVFKIFNEVFASQRSRLVTVMGSTHIHAFAETHLECIKDRTFYNRDNVKVDALALAPYALGSSAQDMTAKIPQTVSEEVTRVKNAVAAANIAGLQLVAYEGGSGIDQEALNRDPKMRDFYVAYLNEMSKHFTVFMNYAHAGEGWGAKTFIGQPLADAHKYRGIVEWLAANPQPVVAVDREAAGWRPVPASAAQPAVMLGGVRSAAALLTVAGRSTRTAPLRPASAFYLPVSATAAGRTSFGTPEVAQ